MLTISAPPTPKPLRDEHKKEEIQIELKPGEKPYHPHIFKQTGLKVSMSSTEKDTEEEMKMFYGYQSCIVRILGNMCWDIKEHQDKMRNLGLIPMILSRCNIDFENPCTISFRVTKLTVFRYTRMVCFMYKKSM